MTQTAPPPVSPPTDVQDAAPLTPATSETVVRRMTLYHVPWALYTQLLALAGNGMPRMTYDQGTLEMEMPSRRHEALKFIANQFVAAYAVEAGIDYEAAGSTTWRREAVEGGLEADESYYIQSYSRVAGKEPDPATDPPPDLAIEIDVSPPDVEKVSVYARLGVPEIWRWRDGRLTVLVRDPAGAYGERQKSQALPDFPLDELSAALAQYPRVGTSKAVADFVTRLRERTGRS